MRIFVLPVSGGAFPVQLGFLTQINSLGVKPDIALGSSGGNVTAYIGMGAGWDPKRYEEIVRPIHAGMFLSSWWPYYLSFLPSYIPGYFKGSIYASGTGADAYFKKMFDRESVVGTEVWSGTLNRNTGSGQLFCNRSPQASILQISPDDKINSFWIRDCMEPTYLDGDLDTIVKVVMASAAIPVIVPEQEIGGQRYVDGGTLFSSPLTPLVDYILAMKQNQYHIDYFSSFDIQSTEPAKMIGNLYQNGTLTIGELVKSICIQDRIVAVEFLRTDEPINFVAMPGSIEVLQQVEAVRASSSRSLLEFYPLRNNTIDLTSFTGKHIVELMNLSSTSYGLRFWWTSSAAGAGSAKTFPGAQTIRPEEFRSVMRGVSTTTKPPKTGGG